MNTASNYSETMKNKLSDIPLSHKLPCERWGIRERSMHLWAMVPPQEVEEWLHAIYAEFPNQRRQFPYPKIWVLCPPTLRSRLWIVPDKILEADLWTTYLNSFLVYSFQIAIEFGYCVWPSAACFYNCMLSLSLRFSWLILLRGGYMISWVVQLTLLVCFDKKVPTCCTKGLSLAFWMFACEEII